MTAANAFTLHRVQKKLVRRQPSRGLPTRDHGPVLLASGLSLARHNSFRSQLRLLARAFRKIGVDVVVVGTDTRDSWNGVTHRDLEPSTNGEIGDLPALTSEVHAALVDCHRVRGSILLGYRDQFPLMESGSSPGTVAALWAQVSAPPSGPPPVLPAVALTPTTERYLSTVGWAVAGIIPHGVDTDLFHPPVETSATGIAFLAVGANTHRKRYDRLIAAFAVAHARLRRLGPSPTLTIKTDRERWTGGFDLRALSDRHGVKVSVIDAVMGEDDLADLYRKHDVFVHAAEWEGFGIPTIEAMSSGVPVVCPRGQGPAELLPYQDLLAKCESSPPDVPDSVCWVDVQDLAERMILAATDSKLAGICGREGRMHAVRTFDSVHIARSWLDVLSVLAS